MSVPTVLYLEFARTQQAGDPFAFRFGAQDYTLRAEGGAVETVHIDWSQELLDELAAVRIPGRDPALLESLGIKLASMLNTATWHAYESQILAAAQAEAQAEAPSEDGGADAPAFVLTIRSAAAELYALPWELLTLRDSGQHLGELRSLFIRYEWPKGTTPPAESLAKKEPGRILFAWSAAGGAVPAGEHQAELARAADAGFLPFAAERDVLANASCGRLTSTLEAARRGGPPISVLHILCHGVAAGQSFALSLDGEKQGDAAVKVDAARLRQLLAPYAGMVRLVVLMACDSGNSGALGNQLGSIAQTLHRAGFALVVASRFPLSVSGSIRFVRTFYTELLCSLSSVEQALLRTRTELALDPEQLDWAGLQLYAQSAAGVDSRPLSFRPYRGLLVFQPEQRRFFCGRDEELQEILSELLVLVEKKDPSQPRFQIVEGPSGVGKSSLVLCGVAPALGDKGWRWLSLRPGSDPLGALDAAWKRLPAGDADKRVLLIVDQLEEIFTQVPDARHPEREKFVQRLWQLAGDPAGNVSVLCTLRTDYRGHCASIRLEAPDTPGSTGGRRLDSLFSKNAPLHNTYVQQMTPERLRQVIERPAERVGLTLAEGLCERILQEVGTEPGALALIQHTLDLLWMQRQGRILTQHAYDALGGVTGALDRHAESVVSALPQEELAEARRILTQLVARPGESAQYTRRCVALPELCPEDEKRQQLFVKVVDGLVDEQLLVVRRIEDDSGAAVDVVEVAHEALIRTWARLGEWVRGEQVFLALHEQIMQWVAEWQKDPQELLTPAKLATAEHFDNERPGELHRTALQLIEESRKALKNKEEERERHIAELQAAKERAEEAHRRVMQGAQKERDLRRIALAAEVYSELTKVAILREAECPAESFRQRIPFLFEFLRTPPPFFAYEALPDEKCVACPNGTLLVTWSESETDLLQLRRTDGSVAPLALPLHSGEVFNVVFFPDSSRVATVSQDATLRIWRIDGSELANLPAGEESLLSDLTISPNGARLLTNGRTSLHVWPTDGRGEAVALPVPEVPWVEAAFSADGTRLVAILEDGTACVLPADGSSEPVFLEGHSDTIRSVVFSPDGSRIVTASNDGTARLYLADGTPEPVVLDVTGAPLSDYEPPKDCSYSGEGTLTVCFACFSPDGSHVLTGSSDALARIWSSDGSDKPRVIAYHNHDVVGGCFSADGSRIATWTADWALYVSSTNEPSEERYIDTIPQRINSAAFSSDGAHIGLCTLGGGTRIYSLKDHQVLRVLDKLDSPVHSLAFSPDGAHAVAVSAEGRVLLFDLQGRQAVKTLGSTATRVASVSFSPDGSHLVGVQEDGAVSLWRTDGARQPLGLRIDNDRVMRASFTAAGARVCLIGADGAIELVAADGRNEKTVLRSHRAAVQAAYPSPDGSRLLVSYVDGTTELHFLDGQAEPVALSGHPAGVRSAEFSRDGARLVTTWADALVRLYAIPTGGAPTASPLPAVLSWEPPLGIPESASICADGTRIMTKREQKVTVWQLDGTLAARLVKTFGYATACILSPDGQYVVNDWNDRLFVQLAEAQNAGLSIGPASPSPCFAISAEGDYLLCADKELRLYPFSPPRLIDKLWEITQYRLPVIDRMRRLGETEEQAQAADEAARQRLARCLGS